MAERAAKGHMRTEFYILCKDGSHAPVIISSRQIDIPGEGRYVVGTCTDISEQKLTHKRLTEANGRLEQRQREIDRELRLASKVQQSLAPRSLQNHRFAVESFYSPFDSVGGDFGLVRERQGRLQLLVCDVAGHGIGAALLANRVYAQTLHELDRGLHPGELIGALNSFLAEIELPGVFVTLAAAELEGTGRLQFASAGHPPALLISGSGELHRLEASTVPIGVSAAPAAAAVRELRVRPGDRLLLYTDGFIDVFGENRSMLGLEGLEQIVRNFAGTGLADLKQAIVEGVSRFRVGPLSDDMSLVLAQYHG